jgi:GT2 family glycosyltransferase
VVNKILTSVVVVSHNEGERLRQTVECLAATLPTSAEILVVDDHSTDGSTGFLCGWPQARLVRPPRRLGVAGARNFGARAVTGKILIFSDAHVTPATDWLPPLRAAIDSGAAAAAPRIRPMGRNGVPGYGFTWRDATLTTAWLGRPPADEGAVPMLCGCFLAVDRSLFNAIGGFDEGLVKWGLEDAELSMRLWRMGHRCLVVPESEVRHLFRPEFPYQVDWSTTLYNILRVAIVHFGERALGRVLEQFVSNPALPAVYARVLNSDVWLRRKAVAERCIFDDRWFFDRFQIGALQ